MNSAGSNGVVRKAVRVTTVLAVGALAASAVGGCSSGTKPKAVSSTSTQVPTSTAAATNPLTGMGASPNGPVIAVKLDDTQAGRPSLGLELSLIHISEPTRLGMISYAVFCLK